VLKSFLDHVEEEFILPGEYPPNPVYFQGLRVVIVFENTHYTLVSPQLSALNIRYTDQLFTDYDCLVKIRANGGRDSEDFQKKNVRLD